MLEAEVALLVAVEVGVYGVDTDHGGQHCLVGLCEIAKRQLRSADAAIDGRAHLCIGEVELCRREGCDMSRIGEVLVQARAILEDRRRRSKEAAAVTPGPALICL